MFEKEKDNMKRGNIIKEKDREKNNKRRDK